MFKKNSFHIYLIISLVLMYSFSAQAAPPITDASVLSIITLSMSSATNILLKQSMIWLGAFAGIQFVITNLGLLKSGADLEAIIGKLIGSLLWFGFCIYVLQNGPAFIGSVGNEFFNLFGISLPSPGSIIASTIGIVAGLAVAAGVIGGVGVVGSTTLGMLLVYILLFIFAVGMFFAVKIFMIQLELGLVVMLSPLSFSFLGLNALKDQGIAPFKALISLGYRILLMTIILSAFTQVANAVSTTLAGFSAVDILMPGKGIGLFIETILSALGAYVVLAYLLWKSDSIAASLAGGGTNMGTGDVASAAAAGAAAGAAIGAGGAGMAGVTGKGLQSMSDFMKNLKAAGSITNASTSGNGADLQPVGTAPPAPTKEAVMSLQDMQNSSNSISNKPFSPAGSPGANAFNAAKAAGASPTVAGVAEIAADLGRSSQEIGDATVRAGGTNEQASAAAASLGDGKWSPVNEMPLNPQTSLGSGNAAGISGSSSSTDQKIDKLMETMGQSKIPTFKDRLSSANDHMAKEQAATHVSINTHHSD